MKKDHIVLIIILLVLAAAIIGITDYGYATNNQTCTMGVNGTAANVTFKGSSAPQFCANPQGWQFGGSTFYTLDQPQGVTLCEGQVTLSGMTADYTIRDTGLFDIVGSGLCKWFEAGLNSQ